MNEELTNIKEEVIEFRKNFIKELQEEQMKLLDDLKAEIVDSLAKNRNKITARKSRLNQKKDRQEFEVITQNHQQLISQMLEIYKQKLENLPQKNRILTNFDFLKAKFENEMESLQ